MANNPTSEENEFSYLSKYGTRLQYKIPTCFEKCAYKPKSIFKLRVSHIYDPSKFWIVSKYSELEVFQKYLFKWYYLKRQKYQIPENKIEIEMYCVVFTDEGFYRGVIVNFPNDVLKEPEVEIFFLDYGMLKKVLMKNLYYMNENCYKVPQFSMRASLQGICPKNGPQWSSDDAIEFFRLVQDKILVAVVKYADPVRQVLEVHLSHEVTYIHKSLISQGLARYFHDESETATVKILPQPKFKYAYLFPSHEALESGKVPVTVSTAEYQFQLGSLLSSIVARYYKSTN